VHDLIIAGGGPVGLVTALHAAAAGFEVLVIEPRPGPIDKACGEGLMPPAIRALRSLGVEPPGSELLGIRYLDGRWSARADFTAGPGLGVRRTDLHRSLMNRVHEAGIDMAEATVGDITQDDSGVRAAGWSARYLVAADGLHSPLRRQLGLDRPVPRARPRWGQRQHFAIAPWSRHVEVHWSATSEAYVTPIGEDLVGVAILSGTKGGFAEQLLAFPALADRLPSEGVTKVLGSGPLRQRASSRVAGRVLLVGDAAGYVDALTGEGIAVGMDTAGELVRCLRADDPQSYEQAWRAASRQYRIITGALLWARHRRLLRPAIVPLAAQSPWLFRAAVNQLAR
jgi:flavin-dependent dehydrogenase